MTIYHPMSANDFMIVNRAEQLQMEAELESLRQRVAELEKGASPEPQPEEKPWEPYDGELCEFSGDKSFSRRRIGRYGGKNSNGGFRCVIGDSDDLYDFETWSYCHPLRDPNIIQLREHDGSGTCPVFGGNKPVIYIVREFPNKRLVSLLPENLAWSRVTHYAVVEDNQ